MGIVDQLARLQLEARRMGCSIRVRNACPELRDVIEFSGLDDVLVVDD
jgi:anti-anti-sigma regulatory factor